MNFKAICNVVLSFFSKEKESITLNTMSIESIKKQITKEAKQNEKLESFKSRLLADCGNLKRECEYERN